MPERARRARAGAALALGVAVLVAAPAWAQEPNTEERWAGSAFDSPFDEPGHTVRTDPFEVSGTMRYERRSPADQIVEAVVRLVDDPSDDVALPAGCTVPVPAVVTISQPQQGEVAELPFDVVLAGVPCNGAYLLEVEARLGDPDADPHVLSRPVAIGLLPDAVSDLAVALDEAARTATVTFSPLRPEQRALDALGYVLERRGPEGDGPFTDVGTIGVDAEPRFVDDLARAAAGTYTYRVRALRAGAGEPERSSVIDTPTEAVAIAAPPDLPIEEAGPSVRDRVRRAGPAVTGRTSPRRPTTATTVDTGFDDALDYGELPEGELPDGGDGDVPLAGQSIVTEEGDGGADLAGPVAGALVLLGWAGHIAYLNRLARQL